MGEQQDSLRRLPAVDRLLRQPAVAALAGEFAHETLVALVRETLAELRGEILAGSCTEAALEEPSIAQAIVARSRELVRPSLRRVWNATGILIHTNLGRAPLSAGAQEAIARVAGGYASLELDLASGERTSRLGNVRVLLRQVTGAEDALAVNNNAAAVFLILHVLAAGREVIVSRGELVEIGGSFRLPDIMAASGARLREVGTTNRTRLDDYARALGPETGLILRVHPSNFVIAGFTEKPAPAELAELAHAHGTLFVEDLGSGALEQHPAGYLKDEPRVQTALHAGADLVSFSGDKLFGGPQAGIILGQPALVERLRAHPLARVIRLEKLLLCALEATLLEYVRGPAGIARIPLYRMLARPLAELRASAEGIAAALRPGLPRGFRCEVCETHAAAGGGSLPGATLPSIGIAIACEEGSLDAFARALRLGEPSIVGRIEHERLILDLRTLSEDEQGELAEHLHAHMRAFAKPR
jgi:L-seryl-tRNA(Ser) seleniumtransferase